MHVLLSESIVAAIYHLHQRWIREEIMRDRDADQFVVEVGSGYV